MFSDIKTRSYTLGEILSKGWKLYLEIFLIILPVILIVYIPINTLISFIPVEALTESQGLLGWRIYIKIIQLLEFFIGIIATMAMTKVTECKINSSQITYQEALRYSLSKWGTVLGTEILAGLIILGLTLLLIVPGVIWAVYYVFSAYVVALRGIGGKEALDYSKRLVKGQWGRVFGILFVIGLIAILTCFITSIVTGIPSAFLPNIKILDIISDTTTDIVSALFVLMTIIFFLNIDYLKNPNNG